MKSEVLPKPPVSQDPPSEPVLRGQSPSPMPTEPPEAAQARARACHDEIQQALARHSCRIAPYLSAKPVGTEPDAEVLLAARYSILPRALAGVVLAFLAVLPACKSSIDVTAARDFKDAVWPRYEAYVRADDTLSPAKRDLLLLTGEAHEVWLRAAGAR